MKLLLAIDPLALPDEEELFMIARTTHPRRARHPHGEFRERVGNYLSVKPPKVGNSVSADKSANIPPGQLGLGRDEVPWHLYLIEMGGHSIRRVGGTFVRPQGVAAAHPHVFVVGASGGVAGLYLIDIRDGNVRLVAKGDFGPPALSPDGKSVALIRYAQREYPDLVVLTVA